LRARKTNLTQTAPIVKKKPTQRKTRRAIPPPGIRGFSQNQVSCLALI
jgi:hypothetical protein